MNEVGGEGFIWFLDGKEEEGSGIHVLRSSSWEMAGQALPIEFLGGTCSYLGWSTGL